jgi:hypothetical protein
MRARIPVISTAECEARQRKFFLFISVGRKIFFALMWGRENLSLSSGREENGF